MTCLYSTVLPITATSSKPIMILTDSNIASKHSKLKFAPLLNWKHGMLIDNSEHSK